MNICHIFCAAGFSGLIHPIAPEDVVIAADGGLKHTAALGLSPHVILGDFDSLGFVPKGANVLRHPVEKDDTDAMLAVRLGLEQGYKQFIIYGGLDGPRLDHTIANFQTLCFLAAHGAQGILVGKDYLVGGYAAGNLTFPKSAKGTVSLFCMGEPVENLSISGLHYTLSAGTLTADFPLGVSNYFTGEPARIVWESGTLLVLWQRQDVLPTFSPI